MKILVRESGGVSPAENPTPPASLPLAGKKVYSAGVIAAYTALANIPVGCVLYGLNLQARGSKLIGRLMIAFGVAGGLAGFTAAITGRPSSRLVFLFSLFTALCFYRFEKGPVKAALKDGAVLARWWPPALVVLGVVAVFFGILCILP